MIKTYIVYPKGTFDFCFCLEDTLEVTNDEANRTD